MAKTDWIDKAVWLKLKNRASKAIIAYKLSEVASFILVKIGMVFKEMLYDE